MPLEHAQAPVRMRITDKRGNVRHAKQADSHVCPVQARKLEIFSNLLQGLLVGALE